MFFFVTLCMRGVNSERTRLPLGILDVFHLTEQVAVLGGQKEGLLGRHVANGIEAIADM